jgi:hypothetical protein
MSRRSAPIDGDALMRAINPSTEPPSSEAVVEAALQRLLRESALPPVTTGMRRRRASGSPRRRLALAGGLFMAAAVAFAAINLPSGSSPTVGVDNAFANGVIARAAGLAGGAHDGVLHIDMLVTQTSANHSANARYRVENWTQLAAPHGFWETIHSGSDVTTTAVIGDQVESYDSATNTLSGGTKQIGGALPRDVLFDPAYQAALTVLYPHEVGAGKHLPRSFSQLIARLIRSPHVTVQRNAHVDRRSAIKITALHGRAVLYVQPRSYRPLEFVTMGDPGASAQSIVSVTMRFRAYGRLPRGSVSPPDLQRLHPTVKLAS